MDGVPFSRLLLFTAYLCSASLDLFLIVLPVSPMYVVYEVPVPCKECDVTYIGDTGRTMRKRYLSLTQIWIS